jgi:hypothetical protein
MHMSARYYTIVLYGSSSHTLPPHYSPASTRSELTSTPQLLTILPQHKRRRHTQSQRNETQHTVSPAKIQLIIHRRRKQREPKARQRPQHRRRSNSTRRIPCIRIHQIRLYTLKPHNDASAKNRSPNIRHNPMYLRLRTPPIPKQPNRHQQTRRYHNGDAEFRFAHAVVLLLEAPVQRGAVICVPRKKPNPMDMKFRDPMPVDSP